MQGETILEVPAWVNAVLWATTAIAAIWLILTLFVWLRRRASNLTSASSADVKKSAQPDFMKVDHKAREEQIKRGESFEKDLEAREAAEAADAEIVKKATVWSRLAGLATLLFSIFSLLSTAVGVIWQTGRIGEMLSQWDKLGIMVQRYPIPFAVSAFVIGFYVVMFFTRKQWKPAAK